MTIACQHGSRGMVKECHSCCLFDCLQLLLINLSCQPVAVAGRKMERLKGPVCRIVKYLLMTGNLTVVGAKLRTLYRHEDPVHRSDTPTKSLTKDCLVCLFFFNFMFKNITDIETWCFTLDSLFPKKKVSGVLRQGILKVKTKYNVYLLFACLNRGDSNCSN